MMEHQYKRLFDDIAPIRSDEELLKAVLDRKAEKMSSKKKLNKKAIIIPIAAAALLGTTAVGVSAAYQWNLPAAFEDLFRNRFNAYGGEYAFTERTGYGSDSVYDFNAIGKEINRVYEFDDYTLNVRGLITDGYSMYIVCDVVFVDGFDHAPKDGWSDWELFIDSDLPMGSGIPGIVSGNTYTFYHKVGTNDNTTLQDRTVTFTFGDLFRCEQPRGSEKDDTPEKLESEELECGVTLEVDIDFDVTRGNKSVKGNTPIYLSETFGSGTLTEFTVTPLGIKATVEGSDIESAVSIKATENDFDIILYHSDNTVTSVSGGGKLTDGTLYIYGNFDYPMDTSDIVDAKLGNVGVDFSRNEFKEAAAGEAKLPAFDFSSIGKEIGESYEGEGYTLTIDGAVADSHSVCILYTLEFNDDFPYDYNCGGIKQDGWFDWEPLNLEVAVNGEEANFGFSTSGADHKWLDDNTMQSIIVINMPDVQLENSSVTLTVGSLRRHHVTGGAFNNFQEIDCGMSVDFVLDHVSGMERSVYPDYPLVIDGVGSAVITEINITPFMLDYTILPTDGQDISFSDFGIVLFGDYETCITLKNGTKIAEGVGAGGMENGGVRAQMEIPYPVNPADVASVTICGHIIDLL